MKTIIAGSRKIDDMRCVYFAIERSGFAREISAVLCGGARGVDALGKRWAEQHKLTVLPYPADWKRFRNGAGPRRNEQMAQNADALILVWDGKSSGSADMLKRARAHHLRIFQHIPPGADSHE